MSTSRKKIWWFNSDNLKYSVGRSALFSLFFIIACFQGYRLGTGDLDTYLPFVYHEFDSSLFKGDMLMETVGVHPVYIWKVMGAFLHFFSAETLFLMAFFVQILIIMAGLILFYREFFGSDKGVFLLLAMMSITKTSAAMGRYGLNPYEYFQPGAMAFGVFLMVFVLWNRKMWIAGGCLGGLLFLFHPFTAITMGLTYAVVIVQQWKSTHFKNSLAGAIAMVFMASPALIPYFHHFFEKTAFTFDCSAWMEIVRWRMKHSFFISMWVSDRFVHLTIALVLIFSFYRNVAFRKMIPLVIASMISILLMASGEIFSSKMLLQLQLARTSYMIFVVLLMFIANRIAEIDFSRVTIKDTLWFIAALFFTVYSFVDEHKKSKVAIILAVLVFTIPVLVFIAAHLQKNITKKSTNLSSEFIIVALLIFSVTATVSMIQQRFSKNGTIFDTTKSDYTDIAFWVRDNVPRNQVVMSPIYLEGFRGHSLHPIYGTYKDGAPHNYCEATVFRWQQKMKKFGIDFSTNSAAYPELYHVRAFDVARSEGIKYMVIEKSRFKGTHPVLFENKTFAIAKID